MAQSNWIGHYWLALAAAVTLTLTGCSLFEQDIEPPPRADDPIEVPGGSSTFSANIAIDLGDLRRALEREVPTRLWSINEADAECIPPQRTEVIGIALKSPTIRCDLKGRVTRGRLTISGSGQDLVITMPIRAQVTAGDIGGVIRQKTANAKANVTARVRLSVEPDWAVRGRVAIRYGWRQPPTVRLLGRDLTFADEADERLQSVVRTLERTLERELARLDLRRELEPLWEHGFAVLSLNRKNPPVWLRLTPQALSYDGYSASRNTLSVNMRLAALTEIFVGEAPPAPAAQPLPDSAGDLAAKTGLSLTLPVVARYSELEGVIERALAKRAERPFPVPQLGDRMVELRSVTAYGTDGNRVAVGVQFDAWEPGDENDPARGTVWLTALPKNAPNSREVQFLDPQYQAETSRFTTNVLLEIAKTQDFSAVIEDALTQNFEGDYRGLVDKVETALAQQRIGDFAVQTDLTHISTGTLAAYGEGLFLPVSAEGDAQIRYAPR